MAFPFPLTPILDTAVRANESPIVGWTKADPAGAGLAIVSNRITSAAAGFGDASINRDPFGGNHEAYVTCPAAGAFVNLQVCVRNVGLATCSGYNLLINVATGAWTVHRFVNESYTTIDSFTQAFASGDSFGFRRVGITLESWFKSAAGSWTLLRTTTDSMFTGGRIGLRMGSNATGCSNFGGGNVPSAYRTTFKGRRR
jgi:hypothetical protein